MDGLAAIPVTILIIVASAFFVSIEFSIIAARRTRLESEAVHSRAARAAVRNSTEVSILLAGSQLGITGATLALGAVTEPAIEHALEPVLEGLGLPGFTAYAVAFALALVITTFLHLVVGEMAPKSVAIAHPERAAIMFAPPMRAFMWVVRPALLVLNEAANALVRRTGVEPVEEVSIEQNPEDLRALVLHSAEAGDLDPGYSEQLASALETAGLDVAEVLAAEEEESGEVPVLVCVPEDATVGDLQDRSLDSGHLRILVGSPDAPTGFVHVRDTLTVDPAAPVSDHVQQLHRLEPGTTVLDALTRMRELGVQVAVVGDDRAERPRLVTIPDLLSRVMPAAAPTERTPSARA